jgi:small-conductance mechanosensitive channel
MSGYSFAQVVQLSLLDLWGRVIEILPDLIGAVIIVFIGVIAGNFFKAVVTKSIEGSNAPIEKPGLMGDVTKWALMLFASLAALLQLGVAPSLIQILFAGIVLALALAFGLGGKKKAEEILDVISPKKRKAAAKK